MSTVIRKFEARDRVHPQVPTTTDGVPGCPGLLYGPFRSGNLACYSGCVVILPSGAIETMPGVPMPARPTTQAASLAGHAEAAPEVKP
jgi:hypothetical protein